ncbi:MAG: hypothetical protein ABW069_20895 [Duganella sp.]
MGRPVTRQTASKARQHGQAMVEFLAAALFVLIPLFIAVTALAKLGDVQHTTTMAARYAAWERTVWYEPSANEFNTMHSANQKSARDIDNEVAMRLIHDRQRDAVIRATDRSATALDNGSDPLWQDHAGTRYLDTRAQVHAPITAAVPDTDVAGAAIDTLQHVSVKGLVNFVPPLPVESLAVAEVSIDQVARNSDAYRRLWNRNPWQGMAFTASGAILSNTWAANARSGTHAMVKKMVPTAQGLGAPVTAAKVAMLPWDGATATIEVGKISVDQVPADRLK